MSGRHQKKKRREEKLERIKSSQDRPTPVKSKLKIFPENPKLPHLRQLVLTLSHHAQLYDTAELQESELRNCIPIPSLPEHKITSDLEKISIGRHPKELQKFYERLNSGTYFLKPTPKGRAYLGYSVNYFERLITVEHRLPITSHSSAYSLLENLFNPTMSFIIVYQLFNNAYDVNVIAPPELELSELDADVSWCGAGLVFNTLDAELSQINTDSLPPENINIYAGRLTTRDPAKLEEKLQEVPFSGRRYNAKIVMGKSYGKPRLFDLATQALWTPEIEDLVERTF